MDRLHRQLAEAEPDAALRQAWVRRWWLRRQPAGSAAGADVWAEVAGLLEAVTRDGPLTASEQAAYERVSAVLAGTVVRAARWRG